MAAFATLFRKEITRFWKVSFQTVLAPVLTALLYLLIFSHVLEEHVQVYPGVRYTAFLVPGLAMMSLLQNSFANSSSSLIQSKITGNIIFVLLPPLSHFEFYAAYVLASVVRGVMVGFGVFAITWIFVPVPVQSPLWVLSFALLGSGLLGTLGIIAGIWADKFDQLAVSELHHHPADVSVRRILFDTFVASILAGGVAFQSVFLHDRRLPLWFFWRLRRVPKAQFRDCGGLPFSLIIRHLVATQTRLQVASLKIAYGHP